MALYVDSDKAVFKNCRFIGDQDTIFASGESSRQYFSDCYIEGTTDFIFGPSTALFENCTIHCKANSFITAANTPQGKAFGFVFRNCTITAHSSVTELYLGRPWRAYAKTVFLNCQLPPPIVPPGWSNWDNPENEKTVSYAEYKNTGAGANTMKRMKWSKQLTDAEAKQYTAETIFATQNATVPPDNNWFQHSGTRGFEWPVRKE